jgi:NADH:ubiquinone oxidoreductase, NADH-binding (51 kD) subunit
MKIKTYEEFLKINEESKKLLNLRIDNNTKEKREILICGGTGCHSSKSEEILEVFNTEIENLNLTDKVSAKVTGCFGFCEKGPIVKIFPDDVFYIEVKPEDVNEILTSHIINNLKVERLLYILPSNNSKVEQQHDIPFYKKQMRIALRNCGLINPEDIMEYIANDGYLALAKCLNEVSKEEIIKTIKDSGLRGRGGAGFPTGIKWEGAAKEESSEKYIVCNADEGDPGAFMDRSILEGDPNTILEAMAIAGYATGANHGYIYIRAEYPLAIHRLEIAIKQAKEIGLLGSNILGSEFSFDVDIKYGAGAFVCGEETALLNSIEGKRGEPTSKPPFPAQKGLFGKPTVINNVETLANVCQIILNGSDWFSGIGTEKSKGTKVFALAGKVNNVGLVEVPMGTTLREIIYDIGGGIKNDKEFLAVQTGGPSGGCLTKKDLDVPIDYESLMQAGSMMGSGGMIVMDEDNCVVDIAKFYMEFCVEESCGKCTPCRIGNVRMLEILERITKGEGKMEDIDNLLELGETIKDTALCGLGQTSPNPILSTINNFYDEYVEHIKDHKCRAGKCKSMQKYVITDKCIGCTKCARNCPATCIEGEVKAMHNIIQEKCIKCGACYDCCPVKAIVKE